MSKLGRWLGLRHTGGEGGQARYGIENLALNRPDLGYLFWLAEEQNKALRKS